MATGILFFGIFVSPDAVGFMFSCIALIYFIRYIFSYFENSGINFRLWVHFMLHHIHRHTITIIAIKVDRVFLNAPRTRGSITNCDMFSVYTEGGPHYCLNKHLYAVTPPMCILIPRGTWDQDQQRGNINGLYAIFNGHGLIGSDPQNPRHTRVSFDDQQMSVPFLKPISTADAASLIEHFQAIQSIYGNALTDKIQKASLFLRALALYCEATPRGHGTNIHREAVRLKELIENEAFKDKAMEDIYSQLLLTAKHAGMLFQKAFCMSPVAYRLTLRLSHARELLISTQLNVNEVAAAVGFKDPHYFARIFHKRYGLAPSKIIADFSVKRLASDDK
ncbi:MAG: helix-turn-helix transcriptional regulator [Kiritimatiellae bacterium]|nr:helix-turn-helix transcriptional regulator [Kiritimatiellia bacterium]